MSMLKVLEMTCDGGLCTASHFIGCSRKEAERQAREDGWIVKNGKHFCTQQCYEKYKSNAGVESEGAGGTDRL